MDTVYEFDDDLDRMTKAIEANNYAAVKRQTDFDYLVPNGSTVHTYEIDVKRDLSTFGDAGLTSRTYYDRLGRAVATQGDDCSMSVTAYDGAGRVSTVSNPKIHVSGTGACYNYVSWPGGQPVTTTHYDYAGRVSEVIRPGSADTDTDYTGNKVTVTDPTGKKRDLYYDALGRLIKVVEDPTGSLNYVTEYTYNTLDKLTQVVQKGTGGTGSQQTRTFSYDSLGRLLSADNPEDSGSIGYAYDNNGNLLRKVDARGVAKCFYSNQTCSAAGALGTNGYDALNRVNVITYSDSTPTEWFCYDGKYLVGTTCTAASVPFSAGRLTHSYTSLNARNVLSFDPLGRIAGDSQTTVLDDPPTAYEGYTFAYTYNRDGSLASQTYPSGRVVNFTYDSSGRPYSVQEPAAGPSYLNSVAYAASGAIDNLQLGNNLVEQTCYNDLLQPVARRLGDATSTACAVQTTTDLLHLAFGYGAAAANNGNMMQQTVWAPDNGSGSPWTVTQDYTYDAVNRLATSAEKLGGVTQWSRTLSYDHFGNRWVSGATGHTLHMATPTSQSQIAAGTNRLTGTGIAYDNAGNLTAHPYITPGSGSMAYDANNKMKTFTATGVSVATLYDAAGRRVRKIYNSETTIWVYDAFGRLAAEYTTQEQTDEATYFRTTDHLGSTRLTTDEVGSVVGRRDYFPFGERIDSTLSSRGSVEDGTLASFNSSPGMRQQFTGQQRDAETGLDYFWERCFCAVLARFFSSDPGNAGMRLAGPQSWNAYSYVYNNPLFWVDPDGRDAEPALLIDLTKDVKFIVTVLDVPPQNPWDAYAQADIISRNTMQDLQMQSVRYHTSMARSLTSLLAIPTPRQTLDKRVTGAIERVNDPNSNCGSLFGSIDTATALSEIVTRIVPTPSHPTLVAGVSEGADWVAVNPSGGFFSGIATDSDTGLPVDMLATSAFSGLSSLEQVQEAVLIHEFLHALGIVGPDNAGQTIMLPNGTEVVGTTGVSQEVVKQCF